jgi:hypothetical protein
VWQVRSGYYPAIFYPGLNQAKQRYLNKYESVYYISKLNGGWIVKKYGEDYKVSS